MQVILKMQKIDVQKLAFRSAALSRKESEVAPPTDSRFLADEPGSGMARGEDII
jgi:hypothetical protein